jgi:hypothetical protein
VAAAHWEQPGHLGPAAGCCGGNGVGFSSLTVSTHPSSSSVVNPNHYVADPDADPDSTYHPDADPDADLDPYFLFDADPDPTFHPDTDQDPTFHPDADPDPDPSLKKGSNP